MTARVERVLRVAQRLSPAGQLELIQAIARSLAQQYQHSATAVIPPSVRRTPPVTDLAHLAADFWPEGESADDINNYLAEQRQASRPRRF